MTKKRKLVVLAVAAVGLVVGSLLYLHSLPKTPFRAGYARVRQGMTANEVHAVMYEAGPFFPTVYDPGQWGPTCVELYFNDDGDEAFTVRIAQGRVTGKMFRQNSWVANKLEEVQERLGF
jgi:hypothetical protein